MFEKSYDEDGNYDALCNVDGGEEPGCPGTVVEEFGNCHEIVVLLLIFAANMRIISQTRCLKSCNGVSNSTIRCCNSKN
jgi:hypothetical protein